MNSEELLESLVVSTDELTNLTASSAKPPVQPWSPNLVKDLSYSVLGFTIIILVLCTLLLWKRRTNAQDILRVFGIIAIVSLSAVLLITGFSNDQLTPIVGLFGAIAGYLLGKDPRQEEKNNNGV